MKKVLLASIISMTAITAVNTHAEDTYFKAQLATLNTELSESGTSADANPQTLNFTLGKQVNENFAIEGLFGISMGEDEVRSGYDLEVKNIFGLSAVALFSTSDQLEFYAKAGLAQISYEDNDGDTADANGLSIGAGVTFYVSDTAGLNLEYVILPDGEYDDFDVDVDSTSLSLGFKVKF